MACNANTRVAKYAGANHQRGTERNKGGLEFEKLSGKLEHATQRLIYVTCPQNVLIWIFSDTLSGRKIYVLLSRRFASFGLCLFYCADVMCGSPQILLRPQMSL